MQDKKRQCPRCGGTRAGAVAKHLDEPFIYVVCEQCESVLRVYQTDKRVDLVTNEEIDQLSPRDTVELALTKATLQSIKIRRELIERAKLN